MAGADGSIAVADKTRRELEDLRRRVTREITRLVHQLDTARGSARLVSDRDALETLARVRLQITAALNEATRGVLELGVDSVDLAARRALAGHTSVLGDKFQPDSSAILQRIRAGTLDEVAGALAKGSEQIGAAMRAGVTAAVPLGDLIETVSEAVGASFSRVQSAVDTAIIGAGRAGLIEAARAAQAELRPQDDRIVYLYLGSDDQKTRPFCREHLDKCFSLAVLDSHDNGQGLRPTSTFLGGYNCRHSLAPMLLSDAKKKGYQVIL